MCTKFLRKFTTWVITSATAITLTAVPAKGAEAVIVAGTTNNGDKLGYFPNSVKLENNHRTFQYAVIKQNGEIRLNNGTTPWCRYGKVQLDTRNLSSYSIYLDVAALSKNPSWYVWVGNENSDLAEVIKADSPASINLLKAVCAE